MKKWGIFVVTALMLLLLTGCWERVVEIRNEDDGRLRLDEASTIDFYLGRDDTGINPITIQCETILSGRKPESVKAADGGAFGSGDKIAVYRLNGATIRMLRYGSGSQILLNVSLGENHVLASGVRIGSTEAELLESCAGKPELYFHGYDLEGGNTRAYVLYGPWYERYMILFEVDAATGRITGIFYELDV